MYSWEQNDVDWKSLGEIPYFIGLWLRDYARLNVSDMKEKYGTVRVYITFGWWSLHDVFYPGYHYTPKPFLARIPMHWFNFILIPFQKRLYRYRYKQAIKRWPHLYREIIAGADYPELLQNLDEQIESIYGN